MSYTRCLSLPVLLSLVLVTFVYYTVVLLVIEPWMGLYTANGMLNGIAYTFWYIMVLWSYMLSTHMDPGAVPAKYVPELEEGSSSLQEVKRTSGEPRFCQKCGCHKPPRTHHCRVCKKCVLRMDHHCIWINNCVGHRNYKTFLVFVFYDVLALFHGLALLLGQTIACLYPGSTLSAAQCLEKTVSPNDAHYTWVHPSPPASFVFRVVCGVVCVALGSSLLVLLTWHLFLISVNKTTIEMASSRKHQHACRKCKNEDEEDEAAVPGHGHSDWQSPGHATAGETLAACCPRPTISALTRRTYIAMFLAHYEGVRARLAQPKAADPNSKHPYDLGPVENAMEIMGPNPFCWLWPTATGHLNLGLHFRTSYDASAREVRR